MGWWMDGWPKDVGSDGPKTFSIAVANDKNSSQDD